ncbi:MAG: hypothetical protein ACE5FJ_09595 [Gemmatimonadales bacterium]
MTDQLYTSHATVRKIKGVHRRAALEVGAEIDFGVHGPIKQHYKLDQEPDLPLPVDFVVAATGA